MQIKQSKILNKIYRHIMVSKYKGLQQIHTYIYYVQMVKFKISKIIKLFILNTKIMSYK
jgi:hypothetical protein